MFILEICVQIGPKLLQSFSQCLSRANIPHPHVSCKLVLIAEADRAWHQQDFRVLQNLVTEVSIIHRLPVFLELDHSCRARS